MSDSFFSPNEALDLNNLKASLDAKRKACEENLHEQARAECLRQIKLEDERVWIQIEENRKIKVEVRKRMEEKKRQGSWMIKKKGKRLKRIDDVLLSQEHNSLH